MPLVHALFTWQAAGTYLCHIRVDAPHGVCEQRRRRFRMKRLLLTTAAVLALSTGGAFAAGATASTVPPADEPQATANSYSGYLFPEGPLPGDQTIPHIAPQPAPTGGPFGITHVYLFPPSDGADGNGAG
jgi:hypothetical protein